MMSPGNETEYVFKIGDPPPRIQDSRPPPTPPATAAQSVERLFFRAFGPCAALEIKFN